MRKKKPKVFISHSSRDKHVASTLVSDLKKLDIDVWYDNFEILVGHDITDKVYEGIMASEYLAVILTKNSVKSRWVREELNLAKQRSIAAEGKRKILPLLFEDCDIPAAIATLRYANFRESYFSGFEELAKSLGITLVEARENPISSEFWQRVLLMVQHVNPGKEISLDKAKEIAKERIEDSTLAFYYTLRNDMRLTDRQFNDFSWFDPEYYEYDDIDVLISDHTRLKIDRAFSSALQLFNDRGTSLEHRRKEAMNAFRAAIIDSIYSKYGGLKHEGELFARIAQAITILASVKSE